MTYFYNYNGLRDSFSCFLDDCLVLSHWSTSAQTNSVDIIFYLYWGISTLVKSQFKLNDLSIGLIDCQQQFSNPKSAINLTSTTGPSLSVGLSSSFASSAYSPNSQICNLLHPSRSRLTSAGATTSSVFASLSFQKFNTCPKFDFDFLSVLTSGSTGLSEGSSTTGSSTSDSEDVSILKWDGEGDWRY